MCGCIFQDASLEMTRIIHPCLYYEEKTDKDMMQRLEPAEKLFLFNSSKAVDSEIKTSEENPCFSCFVFCFFFTCEAHFSILPLEQKIWPLG